MLRNKYSKLFIQSGINTVIFFFLLWNKYNLIFVPVRTNVITAISAISWQEQVN
jgi:hypothetical protein